MEAAHVSRPKTAACATLPPPQRLTHSLKLAFAVFGETNSYSSVSSTACEYGRVWVYGGIFSMSLIG